MKAAPIALFTEALATLICDRLAAGESLRAICRTDGMPPEATVRGWARSAPFSEQYARARELGYEALADEIIEISDDGLNDTYTDADGKVRTDNDVVARSRLRVDSRKWLLSKMLPKVYGDKTAIEHSGGMTLEQLVIGSMPRATKESA